MWPGEAVTLGESDPRWGPIILSIQNSHSRLADHYDVNGYVDVPSLLSPTQVAELQQRTLDIASGKIADYPVGDIQLEPTAAGVQTATTVRKLNHCATNDPLFLRYAKLPPILDIVARLIGPDVKLYDSQLFMKPPGGVDKPYHQDSPYFPIQPMDLVTCWIALDATTRENGCLWVIPGSHRLGPLPHSEPWIVGELQDMRIPDTAFDRSTETPILLAAGDASFHHSLLLHMSHPNRTATPRRGLAFHYMNARSRWTDPTRPEPEFPLLCGRPPDPP